MKWKTHNQQLTWFKFLLQFTIIIVVFLILKNDGTSAIVAVVFEKIICEICLLNKTGKKMVELIRRMGLKSPTCIYTATWSKFMFSTRGRSSTNKKYIINISFKLSEMSETFNVPNVHRFTVNLDGGVEWFIAHEIVSRICFDFGSTFGQNVELFR